MRPGRAGETREDVVEVSRGGLRESLHRVHGFWTSGDGGSAAVGRPGLPAFWRSSMKPFQALPLVEDGAAGALGLEPADLAVCCASHAGSDLHVRRVERVLERAGRGEGDLECGSHRPFDDEAACRRPEGGEHSPLRNNCSGKHAGMLALARHHGWGAEGYPAFDHPVQARIRRGLDRWIDGDAGALEWARDGCGVPTPRLPVRRMAAAYGRLARAAGDGEGPAGAVVDAMTAHPKLVSGEGRLVTRAMEATGGRLLVKEGAEGVLCAACPAEGWGMAVKVEDGGRRAAGPAGLALLAELDLLTPEERERTRELREPPVTNNRGEEVGAIAARLSPRPAGARAEA